MAVLDFSSAGALPDENEAGVNGGRILDFETGLPMAVQPKAEESDLPMQAATQETVEPNRPGSAIIEPLLAIGGAAAGTVAGGVLGGLQTLNPLAEEGAGLKTLNDVSSFMSIPPETKQGKESLNTVMGAIDKVVDLARIPISGLAGIIELATGQGLEAANNVAKQIKENGFSQTFSDSVFNETESPTWGTVARVVAETPLALLTIANPARGAIKEGGAPAINAQRASEIDAVLAAGKKSNVDVLTSDIFPPQTPMTRLKQQFAERIPYAGTSGRRGAQQQQRIEAVNSIDLATPAVKPSDIYNSLASSADKAKKAAGKRIGAVSDSMSELGEVPMINTKLKLTEALESLTRKGKIKDSGLIKELQDLSGTVDDAGISFNSVREFRTDLRSIMDKSGIDGKPLMRTTDGALMDKVYAGVTQDLNTFVKANVDDFSFTKYRRGDLIYRNESKNLTKSRLKTVLNKGDVKPELVNNLLFSSSPSEVALLHKSLDTTGRANARMALMRQALDKSTKGGEISPQVFTTQLDKLSKNFNVFYKGEAKRELDGIKRLLEATRRAGEAGVVTPTGQALQAPAMVALFGAALFGEVRAIGAIGLGGTIGLSAKIYESSGVRNALIKLGKTNKGGKIEADIVRSMPLLLQEANKDNEE
jgi:hypothetical protein